MKSGQQFRLVQYAYEKKYIMYAMDTSEKRTHWTHFLCDPRGMEPKDRLLIAMQDAGYKKPAEAARAIREINKNTLTSNLNGNRPISKKMAALYAKVFQVSASWLLFDEGEKNTTNTANEPIIDAADAEAAREKIAELVRLLSPQQVNVFLSMLQSFLEALGIPESRSQGDEDDIEDKIFLGDPNEPLDRAWLEKASQLVRRQEKALTDQAIFNSEESDRRLKREYNRLYLQART